MRKILIVGALSRELNIVKEEIKKLELKNVKTSYLTTGVGNYNMILNLTRFLENHSFDLVINIGVCGYKGDFKESIQILRIKNLLNNKELLVPQIIDFGTVESIATSEKIVYDAAEIIDENFVDMESYGFEMVCNSFSIPRIIIKVPVDKIGEETKNFDFQKAEDSLKNNLDYNDLFIKILNYVDNHFQIGKGKYKIHNDIIDTYTSFFSLTFSETEIFKKLYFRYLALVDQDFNSYFEKNKQSNKKVFLKDLESFIQDYLVR